MARQNFVQIQGAYPALDRKQLGKPFVADGKNYLIDLEGPKSAFGFLRIYDKFTPSHLMQSFVVGSQIFYFARDINESFLQISTVDWARAQIIPVIKWDNPDPTRPKLRLPWTHALVGTYHYFANRTWGVIRYDALNSNWEDVTLTIGISNIFFLTEAGGRLCTLAEGIASWSAIDNGMDNVPSVVTGAGFQALSLVGTLEQDRDYLGIQKTAKGFLSFTSKGVMRSELVDSINPFRHLPGEAKQKPVNPWCLTKISDTEMIMLTKQGLFTSTDGFVFGEFQPIMGEHFKNTEIPPLESLENGFISLYYSVDRDELYVSFAKSEIESVYSKAWTLYLKRDEWGSFDHIHKGFVFLDALDLGTSFRQAYITQDGKIDYLNDRTISLISEAQNVLGIYIQPTLVYPNHQEEGVNIMITNTRMGGFSIIGYPPIAGWYEELGPAETYKTEGTGPTATIFIGLAVVAPTNVTINSSLIVLGKTPQDLTEQSLDSQIEMGLFRFTDDAVNDQLSLITNVAISCLDATESTGDTFEDWLNDFPTDVFDDWLNDYPTDVFEDWGQSTATGSIYTQKIRGTLDGYQTFEDQFQDLDEVLIDGKTKFTTCMSGGIFQSVEISALEIGQSYHVKTLELNGTLMGRL